MATFETQSLKGGHRSILLGGKLICIITYECSYASLRKSNPKSILLIIVQHTRRHYAGGLNPVGIIIIFGGYISNTENLDYLRFMSKLMLQPLFLNGEFNKIRVH